MLNNLSSKNILIIDDEPKIAEVIKAYLEKSGSKVLVANTGFEGISLFDKNPVDLILLDLMLPDIQGEEVCRLIRQKSSVPIIMVTAKAEEADELQGLGVGADDYMTKPFSNKILMARISTLLRRVHYDRGRGFTDGVLEVNLENKSVLKNGIPVSLSKIELRILMELIGNPSKTFTRDELIDFVLGVDFSGFDRTIDAHIKNLRKKIEDNPKNPKYILTVYGIGYKFGIDGFNT